MKLKVNFSLSCQIDSVPLIESFISRLKWFNNFKKFPWENFPLLSARFIRISPTASHNLADDAMATHHPDPNNSLLLVLRII